MFEELIKNAKKGDKEAFTNVILNVQKDLYIIAKIKLKDEDDICEAVQETMIEAYKNIKNLRHIEYFKTWIIRILINKCNRIYSAKKKFYLSVTEYTDINENTTTEKDVIDKIDFYYLIKDLKNDEKTILTLYYFLNYTTKEISQILKMKESTIRSKISRSKKKLYNHLKEKEVYYE